MEGLAAGRWESLRLDREAPLGSWYVSSSLSFGGWGPPAAVGCSKNEHNGILDLHLTLFRLNCPNRGGSGCQREAAGGGLP